MFYSPTPTKPEYTWDYASVLLVIRYFLPNGLFTGWFYLTY